MKGLAYVLLTLAFIALVVTGYFLYQKDKQSNQTPVAVASDAVTVQHDPVKGDYLADSAGNALYTSDNDPADKSTCTKDCTKTWTPYAPSSSPKSSPTPTPKEEKTITQSKPIPTKVPDVKVKTAESNVKVPETHVKIPETTIVVKQQKIKPTPAPKDTKVITRDDGTSQYSYKGKPLYHFSGDQKTSDTKGDTVDKSWHLAKP